jgi:hypothetical protein
MFVRLRLVCGLALLAGMVMTSGSSRADTVRPPSLIVLGGASHLWENKQAGYHQVSYNIKQEYPAKAALHEIYTRLAKQGWKPLKEDYLNSGFPSSHVHGWDSFIDTSKPGGKPGGPPRQVRQWITDWTNAKGDVVRYYLRYRWLMNGRKNTEDLFIAATLTPAKEAKETRQSVLKEMPKHNKKAP